MLKDRKRKDKKTYNDATKKQQTTASSYFVKKSFLTSAM